jgi:DNA-binding transcriptional MerR regulator
MAEETEVTEPVVETETVEEVFTLPEDFADQVKSWDIKLDELPQAVALHKALQSEDGVIDTFIRTGQNLGFGIKELQRLFNEDEPVAPVAAPAAPAVHAELEDPDRLLTAAEVNSLLERERNSVLERITESDQKREQENFQSRQRTLFAAIDSKFAEWGVTDPDEQRFIASLAEKTILAGADSYDPAVSLAALERGKAQYDAFVEKQAASYLAKKGTTLKAQPTTLGGGNTAAGETDEAPDYHALGGKALDTAKERVRRRLREQGELG